MNTFYHMAMAGSHNLAATQSGSFVTFLSTDMLQLFPSLQQTLQ